MSQITFGKSAYVPGTPEKILDAMENSELSLTAVSEGMVIVTRESIEKYLEDYKELPDVNRARLRDLKEFLETSLKAIDALSLDGKPIGDIFFVN
jgi:hypothetical protein